jgi:hypothetical protein
VTPHDKDRVEKLVTEYLTTAETALVAATKNITAVVKDLRGLEEESSVGAAGIHIERALYHLRQGIAARKEGGRG